MFDISKGVSFSKSAVFKTIQCLFELLFEVLHRIQLLVVFERSSPLRYALFLDLNIEKNIDLHVKNFFFIHNGYLWILNKKSQWHF